MFSGYTHNAAPHPGFRPTGQQQFGEHVSTTAGGASSEKTISCLSCRQRKMKCDRVKPKCGHCSRLGLRCEFPDRKRAPAPQRRNLKMLEARLANLETQLVTKTTALQASMAEVLEDDWFHLEMCQNIDINNSAFIDFSSFNSGSHFGIQPPYVSIPQGNFPPNELMELGLQEVLPPANMINELHELFFQKFYPALPMIHKYRYLASMDKGPQARPPVCLRYSIWAMAASLSNKYAVSEDILYKRARVYIEAAEMKSYGDDFATLYHAQTWCLIAMYEAKKAYFSRSWMSVGRAICLVQKLGLQNLDCEGIELENLGLPAQEWIELEERRRTFWAAFHGDRWASTLTGWPMMIDENKICTNLPASEESFEQGFTQQTVSLAVARSTGGDDKISSFGGVLISTALYGYNHQHLNQAREDDRPEDPKNGNFWKRHRILDNIVSNTFMFLPEYLRLPGGICNMTVVFTHISLHAMIILLHQAAVKNAISHQLSATILGQSQARIMLAAEEIVNIMQLVSHEQAAELNSWVGYCIFAAATVFVKDQKSALPNRHGLRNVKFLMSTMNAIGLRHPITSHFAAQLELEVQAVGMNLNSPSPEDKHTSGSIVSTPVVFSGSSYGTDKERQFSSRHQPPENQYNFTAFP